MAGSGRVNGGEVILRPGEMFNGLKIFSATMVADRERLGEKVTDWIATHPQLHVTQIVTTQSSDARFHCVAITVFYREQLTR